MKRLSLVCLILHSIVYAEHTIILEPRFTLQAPSVPIRVSKLRCEKMQFLVDFDLVIHPELHDCEVMTTIRDASIKRAKSNSAFVGIEAAGDEALNDRLRDLNSSVSSIHSLLFYTLTNISDYLEPPMSVDKKAEFENSVLELSFGIGQFAELQKQVPVALKSLSTTSKDSQAIASYFT